MTEKVIEFKKQLEGWRLVHLFMNEEDGSVPTLDRRWAVLYSSSTGALKLWTSHYTLNALGDRVGETTVRCEAVSRRGLSAAFAQRGLSREFDAFMVSDSYAAFTQWLSPLTVRRAKLWDVVSAREFAPRLMRPNFQRAQLANLREVGRIGTGTHPSARFCGFRFTLLVDNAGHFCLRRESVTGGAVTHTDYRYAATLPEVMTISALCGRPVSSAVEFCENPSDRLRRALDRARRSYNGPEMWEALAPTA